MARRTAPSEEYRVEVDRCSIPVQVFYEYRRNVRVSSGKECVYLRIPKHCRSAEREKFKDWCDEWVRKQWDCNRRFRSTFTRFDIFTCIGFSTFDTTFSVDTTLDNRKTAKAVMEAHRIKVVIPEHWSREDASAQTYNLIHRVLGQHYTSFFEERIAALHNGRFSKAVESIVVRNMTSKWGSCSNTGKMSFSTRLLFAPPEVADYVMIHELCHLDELNHSARFWSLVENYDPTYRMKEKWLKDEGHQCDLHTSL